MNNDLQSHYPALEVQLAEPLENLSQTKKNNILNFNNEAILRSGSNLPTQRMAHPQDALT